jgi:hypothetical protein
MPKPGPLVRPGIRELGRHLLELGERRILVNRQVRPGDQRQLLLGRLCSTLLLLLLLCESQKEYQKSNVRRRRGFVSFTRGRAATGRARRPAEELASPILSWKAVEQKSAFKNDPILAVQRHRLEYGVGP